MPTRRWRSWPIRRGRAPLLGAFRYTANVAVLHDDRALMPQRKSVWASWNYIGSEQADAERPLCVSYWMNHLQSLKTQRQLFLTLNPTAGAEAGQRHRARSTIRTRCSMAAPLAAQHELWRLQGQRNTWFCGSYFGYGFHEDALQSGLAVARPSASRPPWTGKPWRIALAARDIAGGRMRSGIYAGSVMHERLRPKRHRLHYRVFCLLIDLDEFAALDGNSRLFGINRPGIFSFREADHGDGEGALKDWAAQLLRQNGIAYDGGRIELLCYPRLFGFVFNPLSVYFCHDRAGALVGILYEVHNTHGERHTYVMAADAEQPHRAACGAQGILRFAVHADGLHLSFPHRAA